MFLTKMSLPRRTFLQGMGATVALPLLDAMIPAATLLAQTAAKPVRRFGAVYSPNGQFLATGGRDRTTKIWNASNMLLQKTLNDINRILANMDTKVDPLSGEVLKLLNKFNMLTLSIHDQIVSFTPLFHSISKMGHALNEASTSLDISSKEKNYNKITINL